MPRKQGYALFMASVALKGIEFIAETLEVLGGPSPYVGWEERASCALKAMVDSATDLVSEALDSPEETRSA